MKAQEIRGFGNLSAYSATNDFKKGAIVDLGAGVEFQFHQLFNPEVSISYSIIGIKNIDEYNYDLNKNVSIKKDVSAINFTLGPKIYFWHVQSESDDLGYWYFIVPKINMSRITASQNYSLSDNSNFSNSLVEKNRITDWQHSFGLSFGADIPLSGSFNSIALSINVSNINFGKTLNRLPHNEINYNTIGVGAGISYYFGIKKKNKI